MEVSLLQVVDFAVLVGWWGLGLVSVLGGGGGW